MQLNTIRHMLNAPREDLGGESPQSSQGAENSRDEQQIISDKDESRNARGEFNDDDGMSGPATSHIEASELSEEFLSGKVDLVQQMRKTADAIHDSLESEMTEGSAPETDVEDDNEARSFDEEEIAEAGVQLSDDDINLVTSVRTFDEAEDLGVTFDGHVVGDYLYKEKENHRTPR